IGKNKRFSSSEQTSGEGTPMNVPNLRKAQIVDVKFGAQVTIVEPVNLYGCEIGDGCFIGPFVEIQRNAKIGKNCRIQSHSFVCEKVSLGENCFVAHGVMFINDLFRCGKPEFDDPSQWKETLIESGVCIGSNATILPVFICSHTVIGAGAVVTKNITEAGF